VITFKGGPMRMPQSHTVVRHLYAADVDTTYALAANSGNNVRIAVVDVDAYGVGLVGDLRAVFPSLRVIALSSSPKALVAARKEGAALALPKSLSQGQLLKLVDRLARR
jgi:hypothetical protein